MGPLATQYPSNCTCESFGNGSGIGCPSMLFILPFSTITLNERNNKIQPKIKLVHGRVLKIQQIIDKDRLVTLTGRREKD